MIFEGMRTPDCTVLPVVISLVLSGCGDSGPPQEPRRFVYPLPPPRVATHLPEGLGEWLKLLDEMRRQIADLEGKVSEHLALHRATPFDAFLQLDPAGLPKDQLSYLWHFADKGYFTVEREIIVRILEERHRNATQPSAAGNIADRARNLALEYEQRLNDLQAASELYEKTKQGDFHVPATLNDEQLDVLRDMVREKLAAVRTEVARLDARIAELQGRPPSADDDPVTTAKPSEQATSAAPQEAGRQNLPENPVASPPGPPLKNQPDL